MPHFRKKPVVIEAVQCDGSSESGAAIVPWAQSYEVQEVEFHPFLADSLQGAARNQRSPSELIHQP